MKLRLAVFLLTLIWAVGASAQVVEYVHTDALGSPVAITNEAGQVIERTDYEPYGNLIGKANNDRPGYTGHVMDSATGLTYMQQRYYDPLLGRFLSTDPVAANASTGASFNRYNYALNNPYRFTDPDGRDVTCDDKSCTIHGGTVTLGHYFLDRAYVTFKIMQAYVNIATSHNEQTIDRALNHMHSSSEGNSSATPAPGELVGTQDGKSGQQGDRVNNGPLSPEHGGTGNPESDFDHLTGGQSAPAPEGSRLPPGSKVGDNGVIYRPPNGSSGPRIDIPGNGSKPHETLHYPKPPPPPDPKPNEPKP